MYKNNALSNIPPPSPTIFIKYSPPTLVILSTTTIVLFQKVSLVWQHPGIPEFRKFWEEMWLCRYTPCRIPKFRELWGFWEEMLCHWASGIPEFSGNYGNRCHITGPSGILEFLELWEFWEEISYHWAL